LYFAPLKYNNWACALRYYNGDGCAGKKSDGSYIYADNGFVEESVYRVLRDDSSSDMFPPTVAGMEEGEEFERKHPP